MDRSYVRAPSRALCHWRFQPARWGGVRRRRRVAPGRPAWSGLPPPLQRQSSYLGRFKACDWDVLVPTHSSACLSRPFFQNASQIVLIGHESPLFKKNTNQRRESSLANPRCVTARRERAWLFELLQREFERVQQFLPRPQDHVHHARPGNMRTFGRGNEI